MDPAGRGDLVERFLAAGRRERHALLREIGLNPTRADAIRIAPALADPSPRTSARIASILARHGLDALFESVVERLNPGKAAILRAHFRRLAESRPE